MFSKKDKNVEAEPVESVDVIQNGGTETIEERIAKLEARVQGLVTKNCLMEHS